MVEGGWRFSRMVKRGEGFNFFQFFNINDGICHPGILPQEDGEDIFYLALGNINFHLPWGV